MFLPKLTFDNKRAYFSKVRNQQLTIDKTKKGFSLVELIVVIAIIGILVSFGSVSWTNAQQKSRDGRRKADLKSVQQALEIYYQANGTYPSTNVSGQIVCNVPGDSSAKSWGGVFSCTPTSSPTTTYMQQLPTDPIFLTDALGQYRYGSGGTTYTIFAKLENSADPDLSTDPCTLYPAPRNFCVIQP